MSAAALPQPPPPPAGLLLPGASFAPCRDALEVDAVSDDLPALCFGLPVTSFVEHAPSALPSASTAPPPCPPSAAAPEPLSLSAPPPSAAAAPAPAPLRTPKDEGALGAALLSVQSALEAPQPQPRQQQVGFMQPPARVDVWGSPPRLGGASYPLRYRVGVHGRCAHCTGVYDYRHAVNAYPMWEAATPAGPRWLYSTPKGYWRFTNRAADFAIGAGYVVTAAPHAGALPHAVSHWESRHYADVPVRIAPTTLSDCRAAPPPPEGAVQWPPPCG